MERSGHALTVGERYRPQGDALNAAIMHMDHDQWSLTADSEDFAEGLRAFRERRQPVFTGR